MAEQVFDRNYLIKNTSITTFCRGVGMLSGFLLDAVIMALFGLGGDADAFFAALTVPLLISSALGTQFPQVLVPMVAKINTESGRSAAWNFLSNIITTWILFGFVASLVGTVLADYIMPLQIPGMSSEVILVSVRSNKILVWLVLVRGMGDIFSSFLYGFHKYWIASFSRAVTNLFTLLGAILLYKKLGIYALAVSFLIGGVSQCCVLWIALARLGFSFRAVCRFNDPNLKGLIQLMVYPSASQMLSECRDLVENYFASYVSTGALASLKYASRIIYSISGILVGGVVTATLPMVSQNLVAKNFVAMKENIIRGTKLLILVSLPLSAWLIINGVDLVRLLFERGKFLRTDAVMISSLVALMTPYIFFSRFISLTQTPFYAQMDTKTPLWGTLVSFVLYLGMTPFLLRFWGVYGFPISTSLISISAAVVMIAFLEKTFGAVGWAGLRMFVLKCLFATAMSCGGFILARLPFSGSVLTTLTDKLLAVGLPSVAGFTAFLLTAQLTGLINSMEILIRVRKSRADSCI